MRWWKGLRARVSDCVNIKGPCIRSTSRLTAFLLGPRVRERMRSDQTGDPRRQSRVRRRRPYTRRQITFNYIKPLTNRYAGHVSRRTGTYCGRVTAMLIDLSGVRANARPLSQRCRLGSDGVLRKRSNDERGGVYEFRLWNFKKILRCCIAQLNSKKRPYWNVIMSCDY